MVLSHLYEWAELIEKYALLFYLHICVKYIGKKMCIKLNLKGIEVTTFAEKKMESREQYKNGIEVLWICVVFEMLQREQIPELPYIFF